MAWHGLAWLGMAWHGLAWFFGMAWLGHGMARLDVRWKAATPLLLAAQLGLGGVAERLLERLGKFSRPSRRKQSHANTATNPYQPPC